MPKKNSTDNEVTGGSDTGPTSPTTVGEQAQTRAEQDRIEATRTTRKLGENSNGEPTIYPSDVESVSRQFNLTGPEAEHLLRSGNVNEGAANELKGARVVYRQSYEQIPATFSNPLSVADARTATATEQEADASADRFEAAATAPTTDATQPAAGPHGPYAQYGSADVSAEEVAQQTGMKVEDADKVVEGGGGK